jgi:hypothetical protein
MFTRVVLVALMAWIEAADVLLGEPIHTIAKRAR